MKQNEARRVDIGFVKVDAIRTSYVGEHVGWEIVCTTDVAQHVFESIRGCGASNAGYYAIDSLRMEKGRIAWGHEISPDETPLMAGVKFAVKMNKPGGFLGEQALRKAKPPKHLCLLSTQVGALSSLKGKVVWGGEPLMAS